MEIINVKVNGRRIWDGSVVGILLKPKVFEFESLLERYETVVAQWSSHLNVVGSSSDLFN